MEAYCGFQWDDERKEKVDTCDDPSCPEIKKCMERKDLKSGTICPYFLWTSVDEDERELAIRAIGKWGRIRGMVEEKLDNKEQINVDELIDVWYTCISKGRLKEKIEKLIGLFKRNPSARLDDKEIMRQKKG